MSTRLLLCTDLDRTLLPNGEAEETAGARQILARLVQEQQMTLAYVSGRDLQLVQDAIAEYQLPQPDYAITDVGSSIYRREQQQWQALETWEQRLSRDWRGETSSQLRALFSDLPQLTLQPETRQNPHKLSFFVKLDVEIPLLLSQMEARLDQHCYESSLIWSIDEQQSIGLLDVLPRNSNKLNAVSFLQQELQMEQGEVLFCGDSGNDLVVLRSEVPSVLVANAAEDVKQQAVTQAQELGNEMSLYLAQGSFHGLNGCYAAGMIEGLVHFKPELEATVIELIQEMS